MSLDLKDMFLMTPMDNPEFMKVPYKYFPEYIRRRYGLHNLVHEVCVYIHIKKGKFGLKQAALLAYENLSSLLKHRGYVPIVSSLGMWKHESRNILFNLCVDDFGVKYFNTDDVAHLLDTVKQKYEVKVD